MQIWIFISTLFINLFWNVSFWLNSNSEFCRMTFPNSFPDQCLCFSSAIFQLSRKTASSKNRLLFPTHIRFCTFDISIVLLAQTVWGSFSIFSVSSFAVVFRYLFPSSPYFSNYLHFCLTVSLSISQLSLILLWTPWHAARAVSEVELTKSAEPEISPVRHFVSIVWLCGLCRLLRCFFEFVLKLILFLNYSSMKSCYIFSTLFSTLKL